MTKTIGKYLLAIGAVAAVGFGVLFFIQYLRNAEDPEKQAQEYVEALEKAYREDQYGGNTPEETLHLFIDALKKGDTDLAAKYFIIDEQEKWKENLIQIKDAGKLNLMIKDLEREKYKYERSDAVIIFDIINDQREAILSISIGKSPSGKWKIIDL